MLLVINDTHLGVKRQAGTTVNSGKELTEFTFSRFKSLVEMADGHDLLINGDLFDGYEVDKGAEFKAFGILSVWAQVNRANTLYLSEGNHDISKDDSKVSSFRNLCNYLTEAHKNVKVIASAEVFIPEYNALIIPHLVNQKIFDEALQTALDNVASHQTKFVFVHANYDNFFAQQADHSLNVPAEVAKQFADKGVKMIFGHEHKARQLDNVHIVGNQIPTSVSDCLDDEKKQVLWVHVDGELVYEDVLDMSTVFAEVDWKDPEIPDVKFLRVTGTAEYNQASDVVQAMSNIRRQSSAFVVTNAVKVDSLTVDFDVDVKEMTALNIPELVIEALPEELRARAKEVMERTQL